MQNKTAQQMIQEVVDGNDAKDLVSSFVEGKETEKPEEEPVEEKVKSRIEKARRFLENQGVSE